MSGSSGHALPCRRWKLEWIRPCYVASALRDYAHVSLSAGAGWKSNEVWFKTFTANSNYRRVSRLPDPPKPVNGPVPFEGVSPSVIDQSNWSSLASFLH